MRSFTSLFSFVLLALIAVLFVCPVSASADFPILMIQSEDERFTANIATALLATGIITRADVFDGDNGTPTLAQLQQYPAVLVWTDGTGFADVPTMSQVLTDYLNQGGGVVRMTFAMDAYYALGSPFDDTYLAFT